MRPILRVCVCVRMAAPLLTCAAAWLNVCVSSVSEVRWTRVVFVQLLLLVALTNKGMGQKGRDDAQKIKFTGKLVCSVVEIEKWFGSSVRWTLNVIRGIVNIAAIIFCYESAFGSTDEYVVNCFFHYERK